MRIGIIAHADRPQVREAAERIIKWCRANSSECHLCADLPVLAGLLEISPSDSKTWKQCDVIISLGGDGSMLATARVFGEHGIPILGINLGKLGFLTQSAQDQIEDSLVRLKEHRFEIEERMGLHARLPGKDQEPWFALNDVVVDRGESLRLAKIDLYSNGEFVCPFDADGIVVSSPTGSTAYSLSAGGPVINPLMEAIAVSPISAHTLTLRTIIFPASVTLVIRAGPAEMKLRVAVDGIDTANLASGQEVEVRQATYKIKLVKFDTTSFYEVLRTKLHWGARPLLNT